MSIEKDDVAKVAHLARLAVNDEQLERYTQDLVKVLDVVEKMNAIDTNNIEPMSHALDVSQPLREDVVTEDNQRDNLMANAPTQEDGLFLVSKVID